MIDKSDRPKEICLISDEYQMLRNNDIQQLFASATRSKRSKSIYCLYHNPFNWRTNMFKVTYERKVDPPYPPKLKSPT